MKPDYWILLLVLGCAIFISIKSGKLNVPGAIVGGLLGVFIFAGAGYTGLAMIGAFFVLGTLATTWKIKNKEKLGLAEKNKGRRTAGQVIANAGVPAILGMLAYLDPARANLFLLMMAASISSATSDTLSSELGNIYGQQFYNVLTFRKENRGLNGVVSVEGSFFGIIGSALISIIYALGYGWGTFLQIIVCGTIGNISDSILGATLERRGYLNNNAVNFLNTLIAALAVLLFI